MIKKKFILLDNFTVLDSSSLKEIRMKISKSLKGIKSVKKGNQLAEFENNHRCAGPIFL